MRDQTDEKTASEKEHEVFYARAWAVSHHMTGVAAAFGASPHLVAIAGSIMISDALKEIAAHNKDAAREVTHELAQGLVDFCTGLDASEGIHGA